MSQQTYAAPSAIEAPNTHSRPNARWLACDVRTVDRMRSSGRLPKPDLIVGRRSPRWRAATIRAWIESGGKEVAR